jgi:hypothetical protein
MVLFALSVISTVLFVCPVEYLVNCSGWTGNEKASIRYRYECEDGRVNSGTIEITAGTKPWLMVFMLTQSEEREGWQFTKLSNPSDPTAFLILGSKDSPVRTIAFEGDGWVPTIERRLLPPR